MLLLGNMQEKREEAARSKIITQYIAGDYCFSKLEVTVSKTNLYLKIL